MSNRRWARLGFFGLCFLAVGKAAGAEESPHWLTDWEQGRKSARQTGKALFVVFRCEH